MAEGAHLLAFQRHGEEACCFLSILMFDGGGFCVFSTQENMLRMTQKFT